MTGSVVFRIRHNVSLKLFSLLHRCANFAQQRQSSQGRCSKVSHFSFVFKRGNDAFQGFFFKLNKYKISYRQFFFYFGMYQ